MKRLLFVMMVLGSVLLLSSCEKHDNFQQNKPEKIAKVVKHPLLEMAVWPGEMGCGLMTFELLAGQNILAGSVQAIISDGQLFVKYQALEDFLITEAHLFVGNMEAVIPTGQAGNPKTGHFPYFWEEQGSEEEVIFSIDLEELDLGGGCIKIAAHAVVVGPEGEETAWAFGDNSVFAVKSLMDTERDPSKQWLITGLPGGWCDNFTYYNISEALLNPIDLVLYVNGRYVYGNVTVEHVGDVYRFTIAPDLEGGLVYRTHFFAGSIDALTSLMVDCDGYKSFETKETPDGASEHVFEVPVSVQGSPFDGHRWGWYVTYCPNCI
jgi:hypothetical protein